MTESFHTVIIGGGILGCSAAIALARRLGPRGNICIVDKTIVGAGLSSRNSGIVRAVDDRSSGAAMVARATEAWKNLEDLWGVTVPLEKTGALWITPAESDTAAPWRQWISELSAAGIRIDSVDSHQAAGFAEAGIYLDETERCYFEADALTLDPGQLLQATQEAIGNSGIVLKERTETVGFETDGTGRIRAVKTSRGDLQCEFVVNAASAWGSRLFSSLGIAIPVALVPAYVAHWLVGSGEIAEHLPIVGDFVDRACFRRWSGRQIRMHQPRDRSSSAIARTFSSGSTRSTEADIIFESSNYFSHHGLLQRYQEQLRHRFPKVGEPIFAGGFISYFDITPDLRCILGPDNHVANLIHCLGAGIGLKFAPFFGELISEAILNGHLPAEMEECSIARFGGRPIEEFLDLES